MAKWGEGDPRWIVEERPDATNVNNWHWTEKNATEWSKDKLNSLFKSIYYEDSDKGTFSINDVLKCEGEATANNRKGKLIYFFEFIVELEWLAKSLASPDKEIKGKVDILNLSEENEPHEVDMDVTITAGGEEGDYFKELVRTKGQDIIREKIGIYIQTLKEEYAGNLFLPTKENPAKQIKNTSTNELANKIKDVKISSKNNSSKATSGEVIKTHAFSSCENFKCTAAELYNVLTNTEMLTVFTRNKVKIQCEKGGKFELFDGNISGEFLDLVADQKIIQTWRFKTWPANHYSRVLIKITQLDDTTQLELKQVNIPANDLERTKAGWRTYYWESIKRTFGFGATLL